MNSYLRSTKLLSYDEEDVHPDHKINTIWFRKGHLIRRAITFYDKQDFDPEAIRSHSEELKPETMTTKELSESMHEAYTDQMRWTWRFKNNAFRTFENLANLDIDVDQLDCSTGCCRFDTFEGLFNHLDGCLANLPDNVQISVSGLRSSEEKEVFNQGGWKRRNMKLQPVRPAIVDVNAEYYAPKPAKALYAVGPDCRASPLTRDEQIEIEQIMRSRGQRM